MNEVNPYESPRESDESIGNARSPLWLPAWGILTLSLLMLLANLLRWSLDGAIRNADYEREAERYQDILLILWTSLTAIFGIVGSIAMLRMKNRRLVVATAILACVPYIRIAGGCLTAAFGLIALMRLRRKEVWDAFQS